MAGRSDDRIHKICFVRTGHDGDAQAFERALSLAEHAAADLNIVSVVEEPSAGIVKLLERWGADFNTITGERDHRVEVERLLATAHDRKLPATSSLLRGRPFLQIIRKVMQDGDALLVKAAQPSGLIQRASFGHLDRQLMRKCPCPVWIHKPSEAASPAIILAAVNPGIFREDADFDAGNETLNHSILRFAALMAEAENAELHVVHVWHFDLERQLRSRAGISEDVVAKVEESIKRKHEEALKELVKPFARHVSHVHLLHGEAGEEVPRLAIQERADVIVMGTVSRTGIPGFLMGNTAETVLDHADCSIAVLKPPGFISPVGS